ncbi:hypothetical protein [Shewanella waksmanii]|uniref:hypothetical protein n=1 Tax=Shewanella waksmanii TaxID=213783 RepID=UPI00048F8040|nr:hypothetical protein [Shewanella waksmanii]
MRCLPALFLLAIPFSSLAIDAFHVECTSCFTESEFVQVAKENAIDKQTIVVNVFNAENADLRKYLVEKGSRTVCDSDGREPDGKGDVIVNCWQENILTAKKQSLIDVEQTNFHDFSSALIEFRALSEGTSVSIPERLVPSGYDLVGASFRQNDVIDYFNGQPSKNKIYEKVIHYIEAASKIIDIGMSLTAPAIAFEFVDKSKAYAIVDFVDMDNNIHYKFTKVIDNNGNVVDLKAQNPFSEFYDVSGFSLQSWQSLHRAIEAYGLVVVDVNRQVVPKGVITIIDGSASK